MRDHLRAEQLQAAIDDLRDLLTKTQDGLPLDIAVKTMQRLGHTPGCIELALGKVNPRIVGERLNVARYLDSLGYDQIKEWIKNSEVSK